MGTAPAPSPPAATHPTALCWCGAALGGLLALLVLGMLVLVASRGASWSAFGYLLALALIAAGLVTAPLGARRVRSGRLARAGIALMVLTVLLRLGTASSGERLTMTTTNGKSARWLGRVLDEGDVAVAGARALVAAHLLHDPDAAAVPGALAAAYQKMRAEEGDAPSPVVPTYLGLQSPDGNGAGADLIVIDGLQKPRGALVFLHGYAGGFALPCWQIARAAREAGLATFCPSTGWKGDWWSRRGARTLAKTVALIRQRGFERVYLAGLSNGAVGASRLAPEMRGAFRGVILISGAASEAPPPGVPVLVVQGRHDAMSGPEHARAYASRSGGQYVELDAGHFAFLLREAESHRAISAWLAAH